MKGSSLPAVLLPDGKTQVNRKCTILLVKDVVASANYYRDKVGFTYARFWGEPPCFCILWRDNFHLMRMALTKVEM